MRKFLYLVPMKYRLGGNDFQRTYNLILSSETWSPEQLRNYQEQQLGELLQYAIRNVPIYKGIVLDEHDPFRSLERFPIVTKTTIQENFQDFQATNFPANRKYLVTTGGSTGNQMRFYLDNSTYAKEWAFVMAAWHRVGLVPGDRIVSFRGVNFQKSKAGVYWQINPIYNTLECSPFHLSPTNLPNYIRRIREFAPKYIHGYPSAISILAKYLEETDTTLPNIRAVLCVSEKVYDWQRVLIERALQTRVFSFYGMSEKAIMAPECELDSRYHIFPQYGVTEILDAHGDAIAPGEKGYLVGTGFMNRCMPFIRYNTEDYCTLSPVSCACGRNHVLIENVSSRWKQDYVVGRNRSMISLTALNMHSDVMKHVAQYQFEQSEIGEVILNVVPKPAFSMKEITSISEEFSRKVGDELVLSVRPVDSIELTETGKYRMLIQRLQADWNHLF